MQPNEKSMFRKVSRMKNAIENELRQEINSLDDTVRLIAKRYLRNLNQDITLEVADLLNWDAYESYATDLLLSDSEYIPTFREFLAIDAGQSVPLTEPDMKNLLLMLQALFINGNGDETMVIGNPLRDHISIAALCRQIFGWHTEADLIEGIRQILYEKGEIGW